ncbi:hypothetical protein SLS62_001523 [Diatrype stigma]|uniref:Uncharacterized protein n=1 Tax=Diatrype stigma TaxID=117547 RepID=A0AAN9UZM1_9PEZI
MGGFVAVDTLFLALNERFSDGHETLPIFPFIQGILTFDTPFNGLARSMFVYGAFSNYQKVSGVFNAMTALSAAPVAFRRSAFTRSATSTPSRPSSSPAWKAWQLVAVRTGTVGAIAAGGVAAYVHRQAIIEGLKGIRNLNKQSVKEGYYQSMDTLSQGLAYINRGNVGRSFEYLSDHFTFVGALMKQQELSRRLERIASLKGVGFHDFFVSLGENGMWSGGYFVPERTFCAIPEKDHAAYNLFSRQVVKKVEDEVQAHVSMFKPAKNENYQRMVGEASTLVVRWFNDDSELFDDPKFTATPPVPEPVDQLIDTTEDGQEVPKGEMASDESGAADEDTEEATQEGQDDKELPDESPLDITAAASLVPLPDDDETAPQINDVKETPKTTYMRHLMRIAQDTGTNIQSYVPSKLPELPQIPQVPSGSSLKAYIPRQMPQMPSMPTSLFGKKQSTATREDNSTGSQGEQQATEEDPEDEKATPTQDTLQPSTESTTGLGLHQDSETRTEPVVTTAK